MGQALALLYFAGFTSLFFTLSVLRQQSLGRGALQTFLLVLPFRSGQPEHRVQQLPVLHRFGRKTVQGGLVAMFTGWP
jgi:hypothetical protein